MQVTDWEVDPEEVHIDTNTILGRGYYCTVYMAEWRGLKIAVKYFNPDCEPKNKIHLKKELDVLIRIHHPHIIQVLGVCFEPFMVLLEYMEKGSLNLHINKYSFFPTYHKKLSWCKDICLGLIYLHERKPECVIHRDLKPSNILIGKNNAIKITDFGISKIVNKSHRSFSDLGQFEYTCNVGTYRYMAPEVMSDDSEARIYDSKVDIWAFGLIMYEIWENKKWNEDHEYASLDEFKKHVCSGVTLDYHHTPAFIRDIITSCIRVNKQRRPTARRILEKLRSKQCWFKFFIK